MHVGVVYVVVGVLVVIAIGSMYVGSVGGVIVIGDDGDIDDCGVVTVFCAIFDVCICIACNVRVIIIVVVITVGCDDGGDGDDVMYNEI